MQIRRQASLLAAFAALWAIPRATANEPLLRQAPQPAARFAAPWGGWRTVVIPIPVPSPQPWGTTTVTVARPPLITASLPPVAEPGKPLVGPAHQLTGLASYYWQEQMTSSGERFDKRAMSAAHKTLPLGTRVRVTHILSGRAVVVRINDRGPFKPGRIIDLSEAAAEQIGMTGAGLAQVKIEVVR